MNLSSEELKHLIHVMYNASGFTIARGREVVTPSIDHYELRKKLEMQRRTMHW